jgi:hypothetical protein
MPQLILRTESLTNPGIRRSAICGFRRSDTRRCRQSQGVAGTGDSPLRTDHHDEVGYIPFEQDAANLFFQLVSSRYEHASLILTSNLPFAPWGDVFGDQVVASAMIDRIVHHAEVIPPKASATASTHPGRLAALD